MKTVVQLSSTIEQMLIKFAQAMPAGAQMFKNAADAIKQGIALSMAAEGQQGGAGGAGGGAGAGTSGSPGVSPTAPGENFPGGGIGSSAGGRP